MHDHRAADLLSRVDFGTPGAWGILLRHGERLPITAEHGGYDAPLTDRGREESRELGRSLQQERVAQIYTSIVQRCVDTGEHILEGVGLAAEERRRRLHPELFLAAAFVADEGLARAQLASQDPTKMILNHMRGEAIPGFVSVAHGVARVRSFVADRLEDGKLTLFVTHDAVIMPVMQEICGARWDLDRWLPCLGGAVIHRRDGRLLVDGSEWRHHGSEG